METFADSTLPSPEAAFRRAPPELSAPRLYLMRLGYLVLAVGLGAFVWPEVLHHTSAEAAKAGVRISLLAGIGATAILGLRYPVQMLPLLLFEMFWKAIYLTAFALPLWRAGQVDPDTWEDIKACLMVVVFIPLIPWRYVFTQYVTNRSERWA
jgi:hypothetical protein